MSISEIMKTKRAVFYFVVLLTIVVTGCGGKNDKENKEGRYSTRAKNTAVEYVKKMLKNPESFELQSAEVIEDTVPYFLNSYILSTAKDCSEAMNKLQLYDDMYSDWAREQRMGESNKAMKAKEILESEYAKSKNPGNAEIQYMVCLKCSGTNPMGGRVSSSMIVIVDKKDTDKVLAVFDLDQEFLESYLIVKMLGEGYNFKQNKYGKVEMEGVGPVEQFIVDAGN